MAGAAVDGSMMMNFMLSEESWEIRTEIQLFLLLVLNEALLKALPTRITMGLAATIVDHA